MLADQADTTDAIRWLLHDGAAERLDEALAAELKAQATAQVGADYAEARPPSRPGGDRISAAAADGASSRPRRSLP